jgi:hypothetical protein
MTFLSVTGRIIKNLFDVTQIPKKDFYFLSGGTGNLLLPRWEKSSPFFSGLNQGRGAGGIAPTTELRRTLTELHRST